MVQDKLIVSNDDESKMIVATRNNTENKVSNQKRFYLTGKVIFTEVNGNMPNKNRQNNTCLLASQLQNEIHNIDERQGGIITDLFILQTWQFQYW